MKPLPGTTTTSPEAKRPSPSTFGTKQPYKTFQEIEDESFDEFFGPNGPTETAEKYNSL